MGSLGSLELLAPATRPVSERYTKCARMMLFFLARLALAHVGHARCVVPAVKTKQNLVRGRVWCRLSSERVHSMNYTRTRVHHMCYITPRVYSVTSGTRVTVRHACYSTPRVYATRVHHACTPRPGYRPRHAAIWHCPYRYEIIYEEYGCMFV